MSRNHASRLEGGFDIVGGENGLAVAALRPTGAAQSTLYRVNLGTGALTLDRIVRIERHDGDQGTGDPAAVTM